MSTTYKVLVQANSLFKLNSVSYLSEIKFHGHVAKAFKY